MEKQTTDLTAEQEQDLSERGNINLNLDPSILENNKNHPAQENTLETDLFIYQNLDQQNETMWDDYDIGKWMLEIITDTSNIDNHNEYNLS